MKRIIILVIFFLIGNIHYIAQSFDSKNLIGDVRLLMYSDPAKALRTTDYIISSQSSSSKNQIYEALLLQTEIYLNLRKFNLATSKIISANRIAQQVEDRFLNCKYDFLLARIYLELDYKTNFDTTVSELDEKSKILKGAEKLSIQNSIQELHIITLQKENRLKEGLTLIQKSSPSKVNELDPNFYLRLKILKSEIDHSPISIKDSNKYVQFKNALLTLNNAKSITQFNSQNITNLKRLYPEFTDGTSFIDVYKNWSLQECKSNTENCFSTRKEYLNLLKISLKDQQKARVNINNLIDQSDNYKISKQEKWQSKILLIFSIFFLLSIIIAIAYYFFKRGKANIANVELEKENISKEYEEKLIDQLKNFQASQLFSIPEKTENMILEKLESFESGKDFRDPNLSIASLAKKMNTNSKYLSEIINKHKEKNFNNYLNELRINYIVEKLKNNPEYLQYKTSYLAEESGFTSRTTFTTIFKKITGQSPSEFVEQLKTK